MASGLTPNYLSPYPLATDPVDVHGDMFDMADRIDDLFVLTARLDLPNNFLSYQNISYSGTQPAVKISQTGTGNALLVEDEASPDLTPFVITNTGDVGIGILTPDTKLHVVGNIKTTGSVIFEGTEDGNELTLTTADPAADYTVTIPSKTGTIAFTNDKLSAFASTTSSELAGVISDETGTGALVFANGPTINNLNLTGQVTGLELAFGNSIVFEGTTADDYELTLTAGDPTADRTVTLPDATTTLIGQDTTDVLTNKSLSDSTTYIVDNTDNTKRLNIDVTGTTGVTGILQTAFTTANTITLPDSTGTVALTNNKLSVFASTTSAELAGVISDETGTGSLVFGTTPTIYSPVILNNGNTDALRITNTGTGNSFVVEDSTNPDGSPTVIDANGQLIRGYTTWIDIGLLTAGIQTSNNSGTEYGGLGLIGWRNNTALPAALHFAKSNSSVVGTQTAVASGTDLGRIGFYGSDGTDFINSSLILAEAEGTISTGVVPGRLIFSTANTSGTLTERMRIDSNGSVGIGVTPAASINFYVARNITGATDSRGIQVSSAVQSDVTGSARIFFSNPSTQASAFTLSTLSHFQAAGTTVGAGSSINTQNGFLVSAALKTADVTNAFGFRGLVAATSNAWNIYMDGTAANYFAGQTNVGSTLLNLGSGSIAQQFGVVPSTTTTVGVVIRGAVSQTADLLQIQDSAGTVVFNVNKDGIVQNGTWQATTIGIGYGGTGQTTANAALNALLPSQASAANKYLMSDGTNTSWTTVDALPSQTGNNGKFLTTDGTTASWTTITLFPSQSGNAGKFLTTDGTNVAWATVDALPSQTGNNGKYLTTDGTTASWATVNAGGYAQSTPPASPVEGILWLDTDGSTAPTAIEVYRWTKTVSTTTATFSGNGDEGYALAYSPGTEYVYLNGVMLIRGSDYTASTGSSIVLNVAATAGDVFQVVLVSSVNIVALATMSTTAPNGTVAGEVWMDTDGSITTSQNIRWSVLPAAGTTVLTGLDTNSNRLQYVVGNEQVFQNGVLLSRGNDYTATNGLSITLDSATVAGDVIDVFCNAAIVVADTYSTTQSDNKYVYDSSYFVAGKNKLLNSDFAHWQRGSSFSLSPGQTYTADRWFGYVNAGTVTVSRQLFTPGSAPVSGYESEYFFRFGQVASGSTINAFGQKIENARTFAGETVTLSYWAKASTAITITPYLIRDFGSGGSAGDFVGLTAATLTPTWTRYTATIAVPNVSGKTIGANSSHRLEYQFTSATSTNIDIWGVQLESGTKAAPFSTATGNIASELAACQRYYWRSSTASGFGAQAFGMASSTTAGQVGVALPTTLRNGVMAIEYSNLIVADTSGSSTFTSLTLASYNQTFANFNFSGASGLTQFRPYYLINNNTTAGYLAVSSEL